MTLATSELVDELTAASVDDLTGTDTTRTGDELRLTGLEVLGFLAAKVVVPIVCSFVSRELYERYKNLQTRAQEKEARAELSSKTLMSSQVDPDLIRSDLVAELVGEGVDESRARDTVDRALARVGARVVAGTA
jgi:hypothetical protein